MLCAALIAAAAAVPAVAGPREDAATAASAIQSLIDAGRTAETEALARRAVGEAEMAFGAESPAAGADTFMLGRAEALRRAMVAGIDRGGAHADPAN